jgi:hypothetical protein
VHIYDFLFLFEQYFLKYIINIECTMKITLQLLEKQIEDKITRQQDRNQRTKASISVIGRKIVTSIIFLDNIFNISTIKEI